jgi:hypothetical protein
MLEKYAVWWYNNMADELIVSNPARSSKRYSVTQKEIDDILSDELKNYTFPVKPLYNSRIKDNGRTIAEMYKWGQLKRIKSIDIGKQDRPDREFLVDTLLHEYYEAEILENQFMDDSYRRLARPDSKRHAWIDEQIELFFNEKEKKDELG